MILRALIRVSSAITSWLISIEADRDRRRMLKAFPIGTRVRLTSGCNCGRSHAGELGEVSGLSSTGSDYRVRLDGSPSKYSFEFVCAKGMVRA